MKFSVKSIATVSALSALAAAPILFSAGPASAQMAGSYIGAGISAGVTEDADGDTSFGANVQGRFDVPVAPISVRGAALISDSAALIPLVTYDFGIAPGTNLYVGGGYSFVTDEGRSTPLGDRNAPVVTVGVESALRRNIVLYGDAKVGFDAYENSNDAAVSLQVGAAYRF
ncbi:MAG: hypothetical protein D6742_12015 [Cyanobacteria bacterium J069]|nr:MAG: hypothetical protein D6742_12015 [Cyanobacteria bacterium J069]